MTMITVRINDDQKPVGDADFERWVARQIEGRRHDGVAICVSVEVQEDMAHVVLRSAGCSCGVGGRPPNPKEAKLFELWKRRGMESPNFTPGDLISFVHQLTQ